MMTSRRILAAMGLILACVGLPNDDSVKAAFADEEIVLTGVPYFHQRERLD